VVFRECLLGFCWPSSLAPPSDQTLPPWRPPSGQWRRVRGDPCDLSGPKRAGCVGSLVNHYALCLCCLDNVHFQQAAEISEALVEQQVDFEAMVSHLGEANGSVSFNEHVAFCALLSVVHGQGPRAGRLGLQTRLHTHEPLPPEVLCMSSTASLSKIVDTIFSFKCSLDY